LLALVLLFLSSGFIRFDGFEFGSLVLFFLGFAFSSLVFPSRLSVFALHLPFLSSCFFPLFPLSLSPLSPLLLHVTRAGSRAALKGIPFFVYSLLLLPFTSNPSLTRCLVGSKPVGVTRGTTIDSPSCFDCLVDVLSREHRRLQACAK